MESNWALSHPGVFVKDFYKTLDYFVSLGIAFRPERPAPKAVSSPQPDPTITMVFARRRPPRDPDNPLLLELLYIGDMMLEVLQVPPGRSPEGEGEALAYREGINHVNFNVADINGVTDNLVDKGLRIIFDLTRDGVRMEDYLDTRRFGNVILSLRPDEDGSRSERERATNAKLGIVDWKFRGHSVVVNDADKVAEYYRSLEIARVQPEALLDTSTMADVTVYGEPPETTITAKIRRAQTGPMVYEFTEPLEGTAIYRESLYRRGEGIIDLTFGVADLDKETARLVDKGVKVIFSGTPQTGGRFAYFDTRDDGGDTLIKLVQEE